MEVAPSEATSGEAGSVPLDGQEQADALLAEATDELAAAASELEAAVGRAAQAEKTLAATEALADALLGFVDQPAIVLDLDLRVIGWSAGAEREWSRSADDAVGRRWSRLGRSVDPSAAAGQLDEVLLGGAPGTMVPFGDTLEVRLVGEGELVRYLMVTRATS